MKHFKPVSILLALIALLALAIPSFADNHEEGEDSDEPIVYVGTFDESIDGDIVFIVELPEADVLIIAPAGSFSPGQLFDEDAEEPTMYAIQGVIVSEGEDDEPSTLQVTLVVEFDESTDSDGDTIVDLEDNCVDDANTDQADADLDGIGDVCDDDDLDGDGVLDDEDNCPLDANEDQADEDADDIGDVCDEDFVDDSDDDDDDDGEGDGGFYCRNQDNEDIQHPNGARLADAYGVDYSELIADFCGDNDDEQRRGWGLIRRELQEEAGETRGNRNGNGNPNDDDADTQQPQRGNGNNGNNGNGNGNNGNNGNGNNGNGNNGNNGRGRGNG